MVRGSASWVVAIVSVISFIVGALLLTVLDPTMQALFGSGLFTSTTAAGSESLRWQRQMWAFWPVGILIGLMLTVWIKTRRSV